MKLWGIESEGGKEGGEVKSTVFVWLKLKGILDR